MSFLVEEIKHKQGEETEKSEVTCGKSLLNEVRENDTQKEEDTKQFIRPLCGQQRLSPLLFLAAERPAAPPARCGAPSCVGVCTAAPSSGNAGTQLLAFYCTVSVKTRQNLGVITVISHPTDR